MKPKVLDTEKEQPSTFSSKPLCLLVEDETTLGEGLQFNLLEEGFQVIWVTKGQEAVHALKNKNSDITVVILDLMLPDIGGLEVLKIARSLGMNVPILILSAKHLEKEKVAALELGANDYVTKPFGLMELLARVKGLCKWYLTPLPTQGKRTVSLGTSELDIFSLVALSARGEEIRLSPIEAQLFQCFAQKPNVILSREQLLELVWNCESRIETRTVDVFVGKLRKIVEMDPQKPKVLISVRGAGYMHQTPPLEGSSHQFKKI